VVRGNRSVPGFKDRLLRAFDIWSGRHPERPARLARGEPVVLRIIAPLAVLIVIAALACAGFGYVLARQADDDLDAERRQALTGAVEALQATVPLGRVEPSLIPALARLTGLKGLKFESDPADDDRPVQSVIDRKGRIVGWFTWEAERPATAMVTKLAALIAFIVLGLVGFAALAMWQLSRLGLLLARSEQQVHKLTYEDPLTGLPNHSQLFDLFDQALVTRAGDATLVYAVIDLDGFDEVNDAVGYAGGDEVLVEVAKRLREIAPDAVVGRLGSDEFALLMADIDRAAALQIADAARHAIARPIWMNQFVQVVASIGLVVVPEDGAAREELTRRADLALRVAKRRGHGAAVAYSAAMETEIQERRFIKREVARAIAARAFDLHYQPIVKAERGAIAGVEALLRWNHPTRGAIPPSVFVPVAEEAGLMDQLGEFVLRRAIADAARWPDLYVSVNLSPVQIRDRAFVDVVSGVLKESGFEPSRLVLEMTEGVLIENPDETAARLLELRALGVRLALDDFGSGYSSLSYLQRLPFNKVKIDRSFVTSLDHSANGGVIIQAVVTLCRALGMSVVIEGVETEEQRVLVRLAGCNEMQGYLFAKPAPREEIDRLLANAKSAPEEVTAPLRAAM
jgi:diguanylate cyclase (GGDEF)-like protein